MEDLTKLLKQKNDFFTEKLGFKIQDYDYSPEFGGSSYLIYVKDSLSVMVAKSRDGLSYQFKGNVSLKKHTWFSLDIIRLFLENMETYRKLKSIDPIMFISDNIYELEQAFADDKLVVTIEKLNDLKRKRAKKLFK